VTKKVVLGCVFFIPYNAECLKGQKRLVEKKSLDNGTNKGDHSKSSVNDFLFLAPRLVFGGHVGQDGRSPLDVSGDGLIIVVLVEVGSLNNTDGEQDLHVNSPSDRLDGTEDVGVGVHITREVDAGLLDNHTYDSKHADTSVLDFGPTSVSQVGLNVRKTHRVESKITGHGSIELVGFDQERNGLREFLGIEGDRSSPLGGLRNGGEGRSTCDQKGKDSRFHHGSIMYNLGNVRVQQKSSNINRADAGAERTCTVRVQVK